MLRGIPYGTVAPITWRNCYFGRGFKAAPKVTIDRITKQRKYGAPDWKQAAINQALQESIILPRLVDDQKDAAEAIGICYAWHLSKVPNIKWMQDRVIELKSGKARAAA